MDPLDAVALAGAAASSSRRRPGNAEEAEAADRFAAGERPGGTVT